MKILVADKFEAWGVEQLKALTDKLAVEPDLSGDALRDRLASFDPEILIVRSTKVPGEVMAGGKSLRMIIRAGSGYDTIDVAAASAKGVWVTNCPGMNSAAVAELTIGLMIALDRRIPDNVAEMRAHKWNKKGFSKSALGFNGRTIGIIGAGRIGSDVARIALAMGMKVVYYHLGRQRRLVDFTQARRAELDELLAESDVVTIHIPGGPSTKHLLDAERIAKMKRTALLLNTSRASVIDENAMIAALKEGRIRGAAVDVYENEPAADATEIRSPLCDVPNLYGTHHIGASTEEAQLAVAAEAVRIVRAFKNREPLPNCVNVQQPKHDCLLVVRMHNRPGSLAHVFQVLGEAQINAEEMDHVIYDGGHAACAHIRIDRVPDSDILGRIAAARDRVLGVEAMTIE